MNDFETIKQMLIKKEFDFEILNKEDLKRHEYKDIECGLQIENNGPNDLGYGGFITCWYFDKDYNLTNIGNWE